MHPKVDLSGGNLEVVLELPNPDLPEKQKMTGVVVDENGAPVKAASVRISGAAQNGRVWGGSVDNTDLLVFTDQDGKFLLTSETEFDQWKLTVTAHEFARLETPHLETGNRPHRLVLPKGCTITGRVVQNGVGVPNHVVSICHSWRSKPTDGVYGGQTKGSNLKTATTDEQGRFEFANTIADSYWYIFSSLDGPPQPGAIACEEFESRSSGSIRELGDFELLPTRSISGKIIVAENQKIPEDLAVYATLEFGHSSRKATVHQDGSFEIDGLPQDQISLYVGYPYDLIRGKHKFQEQSSIPPTTRLQIKLEDDLSDVELYLSPTK
jgi:uncharacterized GH25 family protein